MGTDATTSRTRILSATTAGLLLALAVSGCRFGNHIETQPIKDPLSGPVNGYYNTKLQGAHFYALTTTTQSGDSDTAPGLWGQVFTDPVILFQEDATSVDLISNTKGTGIKVGWSANQTVYNLAVSNWDTLWTDPACQVQLSEEVRGSYTRQPTSQVFDGRNIQGRLSVTVTKITNFEAVPGGSCAQTLQDLQDCYRDVNLCKGGTTTENQSRHQTLETYFAPYIASHAITDSDIPNLRNLRFVLNYE